MEEKKKFSVEFTLEELQTVVDGLQKQPYERVAPIINSIMAQYNTQVAPPKEAEIKKKE